MNKLQQATKLVLVSCVLVTVWSLPSLASAKPGFSLGRKSETISFEVKARDGCSIPKDCKPGQSR